MERPLTVCTGVERLLTACTGVDGGRGEHERQQDGVHSDQQAVERRRARGRPALHRLPGTW